MQQTSITTRLRVLALLLAFSVQAGRGNATVLAPADLVDLTRDSGAIVRGRITAVSARWTEDRRAVETLVTVDVESSLKGPFDKTAQFLVPGGTLGRYRSVVVGAPQFDVGQRVIVFLAWQGPTFPHLVGFSQGVFRIVNTNSETGSVVVPAPIVRPAVGGTAIVRGDPARQTPSLVAFEQRVRALVGGAQQ
jgi:hypothetical protein